MTCREITDFLAAYLDGELADEVRVSFDEHLAGCPECTAYLETYRATVTLAKGAFRRADASVPPDVAEKLTKAILAARRKRL